MSLMYVRNIGKFLFPSSSLRTRFRLNSTIESSNVNSTVQTKEKIVNRWLNFWKVLLSDYKTAFVEIAKIMKDNPAKTLTLSSLIGFSTACNIMNPDDVHYRDNLIRKLNELIFIPKTVRNAECTKYLETIEWAFNCNEIRRVNFGLFSVILREPHSKHSALYKDNCPYLQPSFIEIFNERLLDIGFWNRWWMLERMMVDYDINSDEWK